MVEVPPFFPNKIGRILLLATEEVIGKNGLKSVLNLARLPDLIDAYPPGDFERTFPFESLSRLVAAIDEMYGPRSGQLLSLRIGRACFRYGIRDFGGLLSVADVAFRLLPLGFRVRLGMEVLAEILNRHSDQHVSLREDSNCYYWVVQHCGVAWGRQSLYPACSLSVGLLQESLFWVSGGKLFDVEELTCTALGDPTCTLAVTREPLE